MTKNNNPGCLTPFIRLFQKSGKPQKKDDLVRFSLPADEPEVLPYFVREDFFSAAEASFFRVLKTVVGENLIICPKVSLAEIFYVSHPEVNLPYFNKINRKHVDFVLCSPKTLKPVLAIELDDSSHQRADRVERDEFVDDVFATAGLRLIHVPVQRAYSTEELRSLLQEAFGGQKQPAAPDTPAQRAWSADREPPFCPNCGTRMVLRTAARGSNAGQQFYGCPNYPKCQKIIPIAAKRETQQSGS